MSVGASQFFDVASSITSIKLRLRRTCLAVEYLFGKLQSSIFLG